MGGYVLKTPGYVHPRVEFKTQPVNAVEMASNKYYLEDTIVLAWARRNVPGSFAHVTMVLNAVNGDGLLMSASPITLTLTHNQCCRLLGFPCWYNQQGSNPDCVCSQGAVAACIRQALFNQGVEHSN